MVQEAEAVRTLLQSLVTEQAATISDIGGGRQLVEVVLPRSQVVEAVMEAQSALVGTGWTAYAGERSSRGETIAKRVTGPRHLFGPIGVEAHEKARDWTPDEVLAVADAMTDRDVGNQLAALEKEDSNFMAQHMDLEINRQLASTERRYGRAPTRRDMPPSATKTPAAVDSWLLEWEQQQDQFPQVGVEFPSWMLGIGDGFSLAAIPWERPDAVVAADLFWGGPAPLVVALIARWNRAYGTRVIALSGLGLALQSERLPSTVQEAHQLARAIDLISNHLIGANGPSQSRRAYAYGLMAERQWWMEGRL